MVAGRTAAARSKASQEPGGFRKARVLSFVILGEVGWVLPPALGLLGIYVACCLVYCQQSSGCFFPPFGKDCAGSGSTRGHGRPDRPKHLSLERSRSSSKLPLLTLDCLTDWDGHRLCEAESNLALLLTSCVVLDTFITLSEP